MSAWDVLWSGQKLGEEEKKQICNEMMTTECRIENLI